MAQVKVPPFVSRLKKTLKADLDAAGIPAQVSHEPILHTKLYRFTVLARGFRKMSHSERQDFVWRSARRTLRPEEELLVSMILTLTPDEAVGAEV